MTDIDKQIEYWRAGAGEDWEVAVKLVQDGQTRHDLFFAHLSLEKMLKALICRRSNDLAPRLHNLTRLSEMAGLSLDEKRADLLADMNQFHIEGRYPGLLPVALTRAEADGYLDRAEEVMEWLRQQL
ncbi:MAG: HEPN domain-containing protein [Pseudomonadota bacterium]